MPPRGWKKDRDMSRSPLVDWEKGFLPFGNRLHFLSRENQQLIGGQMNILPPKDPSKRTRGDA